MEIQWGEYYIHIERTVAILLIGVPLVLMLQLPTIIGMFQRKKKVDSNSLAERVLREESRSSIKEAIEERLK